MGTSKENRSKGFKGRVRMVCVALDYEGTDAPLGCRVDSQRGSVSVDEHDDEEDDGSDDEESDDDLCRTGL